jgi:hypothetical protein
VVLEQRARWRPWDKPDQVLAFVTTAIENMMTPVSAAERAG